MWGLDTTKLLCNVGQQTHSSTKPLHITHKVDDVSPEIPWVTTRARCLNSDGSILSIDFLSNLLF